MATKTTEIKFLGLGNNPSDYVCKDGNLALAINMVHEQGSLRPAKETAPRLLVTMPVGYHVIYRHCHASYRHLVYRDAEGALKWINEDSVTEEAITVHGQRLGTDGDWVNAPDIKCIIGQGHILKITTESQNYVFLWKESESENDGESGNYHFLGHEVPELDIRFGLVAHTYKSSDQIDSFKKDFDLSYYLDSKKKSILVNENYKLPSLMTTDCILERDPSIEAETSGGETKTNAPADGTNTETPAEGTGTNTDTSGGETNTETSNEETDGNSIKGGNNFLPDDVKSVSDAVLGEANKFNNEWCTEKGYFSQPFLVRASLLLFDGTTTRDTAPVLMIPSTKTNPVAPIMMIRKEGVYFDMHGVACSLRYFIPQSMKETLEQWKDIIRGINIYVSAPFYTYDPDGKCKRFVSPFWRGGDELSYSGPTLFNTIEKTYILAATPDESRDQLLRQDNFLKEWSGPYSSHTVTFDTTNSSIVHIHEDGYYCGVLTTTGNKKKTFFSTRNFNTNVPDATNVLRFSPIAHIPLPWKSASQMREEIRSCSLFYLAESVDVEDIVYDGADLDLSGGKLSNITTKETLSTEFESHHSLIPSGIYSYNNRLNEIGIKKHLFQGFTSGQLLPKCDQEATIRQTDVFVYVRKANRLFVMRRTDNTEHNWCLPRLYTYYPDPDAYRMVIYIHEQDGNFYNELPLREHRGLNAAIYCGSIADFPDKSWVEDPEGEKYRELMQSVTNNETERSENLLYTTEVNNPFVFKARNVEQIGNGKIITLAPSTLPLSQGQYGFAEMYCFTTDGIWALKVSDTGGWSAKQPFHYDVVLKENRNNILRMERDIIFSSQRGLMMLAGNSIDCISEVFHGEMDALLNGKAWSQQYLREWKEVIDSSVLPRVWTGKDKVMRGVTMYDDFSSFISNAVYLYDYTHQRIIIGNPCRFFSYVFSLEDRFWTTVPLRILAAVNSFPECIANVYDCYNNKNALVDFAASDSIIEEGETMDRITMPENGLLLTRPIKLSSPSVQKTIRTINLHGVFDKTHAAMILLGCNDNLMKDWFVVSSCEGSRLPFRYGTPFKAFRLAVVTRLDKGESVDGATIEYEYKELNKERQ